TTTSTATPVLTDVTICDTVNAAPLLVGTPATATYGGSATLSATLTSGGNPVIGRTVTFTLDADATAAGSATTDGNGVATLLNVSLGTRNAGAHTFSVAFSGDNAYA